MLDIIAAAALTVTVQSGDTLSQISARYGASWPVVCQVNRLRSCDLIYPGQRLIITKNGHATGAVAVRPVYRHRGYSGASGSYESCVIARESGGDSQVMNSSGHYGLYQFSASTWVAYGGSAATFGHASAAEQRRVFSSAMAQGGQSNWSPYDGC